MEYNYKLLSREWRQNKKKEISEIFELASKNDLDGILSYEERPLVSIGCRSDVRSATLDAEFTAIINDTQLKVCA